ncbi:hypothetical protein [Reichenbachiella sp. MALMAid0571]|uniref:hypothetical protein n=1 Tax=Reichenbachiella sp. MALMAid0571 TaxID=3143939 RepID=UPI0032DEA97D
MKNPLGLLHKKIMLIVTGFLLFQNISAQDISDGHIEEEYDHLTAQWLEVSGELKTYSGLTTFCKNPEYSTHTVKILETLHHYDSLVLDIMENNAISQDVNHKELKKTSKDITKFETEYGIKAFIEFLKESCNTRKDLEKNKKELMKDSGMYSYDGQLLVLETQLRKFLLHIDKRIVSIDDHLHMIHPDQIQPVRLLTKK